MTVLSNNVINPDDVAAYWLDVLEETVNERVDYEGNQIEPDYEYGGGGITIGNRRIRVVGAWSEVVFQWFEVGTAKGEGDYRLPLTFDDDETVDRYGTTAEELLDEAVEYLDYDLWAEIGGCDGPVEEVKARGEARCYQDADGVVWSYGIDPERGNADLAAGLYDEETGKVDWTEYGFIEGLDVLLMGMASTVAEAVADVKERLGV